MSIKSSFQKSFWAITTLGLMSLVLGFAIVPNNAKAVTMVSGSIIATPDTIDSGDSTQLKWNSFNATDISISPGIGSVAPSGSMSVSPTQTTTYTLTIQNDDGGYGTGTATVYVNQAPSGPSVNISASPSTICPGNSSQLSWSSSNATNISINQGIGSVSSSGNRSVSPSQTTTYTITATNSSGASSQDSVTITVNSGGSCGGGGNLPTVTLRADDTSIDEGEETELEWTSSNADYCERTGGRNGWSDNRVGTRGDFDTGELTRDTTYHIRCHNEFGSASDSETVRVNEDDDTSARICRDSSALNYRGSLPCRYQNITSGPTVVIYADHTSLPYNGATFVRWSSIGATSCQASGGSTGWAGPKSIGPGSFYTGSLTSSRTYTITCYNSSGVSDTDSVTIAVRPRVVTSSPRPPRPTGSSLVLITSTIDRNQPIMPTLDNTRPCPGDEITYTATYQNIGTAAITNLVFRLDLPREVNYMYSTPPNPMISGNTLIFNLGTLQANGTGTITVRVRVREDSMPGAPLNFPATLSYIDPAGFPQTVSATVSGQVCSGPVILEDTQVRGEMSLAAALFGSGDFFPDTLFGWLLLILLILALIAIVRYLMAGGEGFSRRTTTTTIQH